MNTASARLMRIIHPFVPFARFDVLFESFDPFRLIQTGSTVRRSREGFLSFQMPRVLRPYDRFATGVGLPVID